MRRLKLLGLALMAVFTSAVVLSASAFAMELPENLPALAVGETRTWTGVNIGNVEFRVATTVCTAAKSEGTETSSKPPFGLFHIAFEKCASLVAGKPVTCTGLGDVAGIILVLGDWDLVFDKEVGKPFKDLTSALLLTSQAVHFVCGGLILYEVLAGETLCLHLKPTESNVTHEFHCLGEGTKPLDERGTHKTLTNSEGVTPLLKASINHSAEEISVIWVWLGTVTYKVALSADQ